MFLNDLKDCSLLFADLPDAIETLLNDCGSDFLAILLEFGNYLVDLDAGFLDETVEVDGSLARAFRTFL